MSVFLGYLFIFFSRVVDVTLTTIRMLMVMQGRKVQATIIGFFEISIYITVLGKVVNNLDNIGNLFAYASGFACGTYVGMTIENRIALGSLSAQIVLKEHNNIELVEALRESGFGVTVLEGQGREGNRKVIHLVINRKDLDKLKDIVYGYDDKAFITVSSINPISGGYFSSVKKK